MCKKMTPWKFTSDNYSIVWQGPATTTLYHPSDDYEEERQFEFMGTCVDQHVMAACWRTDDAKSMGMVPSMIPIHFTICREVPTFSTARVLMMNESFQIPMAEILQTQLMVIDETVSDPCHIKAIKIKIAIPNNELPSMDAVYCDPDGEVHEIQETIVDNTWAHERKRVCIALIDLATDVDAVAAIRSIIPNMDVFWKAYVEQMYPSDYEIFKANLEDCIQEIQDGRACAAKDATTYRERIMPRYNPEIMTMVSEGMAIVGSQIKSLDEATCKDIYESRESGPVVKKHKEVTLVCDDIPGKQKTPTGPVDTSSAFEEDNTPPEDSEKGSLEFEEYDDDYIPPKFFSPRELMEEDAAEREELRKENKDNPCFNFHNYKPGNPVPGWAIDNTKEGFAQIKPEYKDYFDKK